MPCVPNTIATMRRQKTARRSEERASRPKTFLSPCGQATEWHRTETGEGSGCLTGAHRGYRSSSVVVALSLKEVPVFCISARRLGGKAKAIATNFHL